MFPFCQSVKDRNLSANHGHQHNYKLKLYSKQGDCSRSPIHSVQAFGTCTVSRQSRVLTRTKCKHMTCSFVLFTTEHAELVDFISNAGIFAVLVEIDIFSIGPRSLVELKLWHFMLCTHWNYGFLNMRDDASRCHPYLFCHICCHSSI